MDGTQVQEAGPFAGHSYRFGPYRFEPMSGLLATDGAETILPGRAAGVLQLLLNRPGRLVTKRELLAAVWEDAHVTEGSLTDVVSALRQAIGDDPRDPTYIQTIHRRGYRFLAQVTTDTEDGEPAGEPGTMEHATPPPMPAATSWQRPVLRFLPWGIAGLLAALGLAGLAGSDTDERIPATPRRLALDLGSRLPVAYGSEGLAISPGGDLVAYVSEIDDWNQLVLRRLDEREGRAMPGTDRADGPFFSPNGRWLAFFQQRDGGSMLMKVSVDGGEPSPICEVHNPSGGSWGDDDVIVYGSRSGLMRVRAAGGTAEPLTTVDREAGETGHILPNVLPRAGAVLYMTLRRNASTISVRSLHSGATTHLSANDLGGQEVGRPIYLPTGDLLYLAANDGQARMLMAVPFDAASFRITGPPIPVTERGMNLRNFAVSLEGTLLYQSGPQEVDPAQRRMMWVDRSGGEAPVSLLEGDFRTLRLSPDGDRIAAEVFVGENAEIWIFGLADDSREKVAPEGFQHSPLWSKDGASLYFGLAESRSAARTGGIDLYSRPVDFSSEPRLLLQRSGSLFPTSWTGDGSLLLHEMHSENERQILVLPLTGGDPEPYLRAEARFDERSAMVSPDGHWILYVSDESGRDEVYLRPFPGLGGRKAISNDGGTEPLWSASAGELFYRQGERLIAVQLETDPEPRVVRRTVLFKAPYFSMGIRTVYDYDPRRDRFLMAKAPVEAESRSRLQLVLNWFEELDRLAQTGR